MHRYDWIWIWGRFEWSDLNMYIIWYTKFRSSLGNSNLYQSSCNSLLKLRFIIQFMRILKIVPNKFYFATLLLNIDWMTCAFTQIEISTPGTIFSPTKWNYVDGDPRSTHKPCLATERNFRSLLWNCLSCDDLPRRLRRTVTISCCNVAPKCSYLVLSTAISMSLTQNL